MTQIGQTSSESGSPKLPDYNSLYGSTDYLEDPDCWSPEDDVILQAYQLTMKNKLSTVDTMSQMSVDSSNSSESKEPVYFAASDIRRRLTENVEPPKKKFEVSKHTIASSFCVGDTTAIICSYNLPLSVNVVKKASCKYSGCPPTVV